MITLDSYKPKHPFLICCDSDGCAIDTMDIKHIQCFGPCLVKEFGLHEWENEILTRWNEINLYTMTRGINRFKGLVLALKEIDEMYTRIEGFEMLYDWVETAKELSESALRKIIDINSNIIFKKALQWSQSVNESIDQLSMEDKKAFNGVKESLEFLKDKADIVIVSSANLDAVLEEWENNELLNLVDLVCAQNDGSKKYIIEKLIQKGYERENIIMCGDAPGDFEAAKENQVFFYPILVGKEEESWKNIDEAFERLTTHTYGGAFETEMIHQFQKNLGAK